MKRKISFIVAVFLTVFAAIADGQQALFAKATKKELPKMALPFSQLMPAANLPFFSPRLPVHEKMMLTEPLVLSGHYYLQHLGFFCMSEYKFEKTMHVPLRFRLGSLEECNRLEGK